MHFRHVSAKIYPKKLKKKHFKWGEGAATPLPLPSVVTSYHFVTA